MTNTDASAPHSGLANNLRGVLFLSGEIACSLRISSSGPKFHLWGTHSFACRRFESFRNLHSLNTNTVVDRECLCQALINKIFKLCQDETLDFELEKGTLGVEEKKVKRRQSGRIHHIRYVPGTFHIISSSWRSGEVAITESVKKMRRLGFKKVEEFTRELTLTLVIFKFFLGGVLAAVCSFYFVPLLCVFFLYSFFF